MELGPYPIDVTDLIWFRLAQVMLKDDGPSMTHMADDRRQPIGKGKLSLIEIISGEDFKILLKYLKT